MRRRTRMRLLGAAAAVATVALGFGARPALASGFDYTATFAAVQGLGTGPSLSCGPSGSAANDWMCDTTAPITASGITCQQTTTVNTPVTGCIASLSIDPGNWPGQLSCDTFVVTQPSLAGHHCVGNTDGVGSASFSFQPVAGSGGVAASGVSATITDAECTENGGRATLEAVGSLDPTTAFSMVSTITWVGSCTSVAALTWTGSLTAISVA